MKERTKSWMDFAARDMEAARSLIKNEYLANIVLFHSQQCVEKSLKAVLDEHGADVPRIHSVVRLYTLIQEHIGTDLNIAFDKLNAIDDIYVDTRYPHSFGILPSGFPSEDDARQTFEIA